MSIILSRACAVYNNVPVVPHVEGARRPGTPARSRTTPAGGGGRTSPAAPSCLPPGARNTDYVRGAGVFWQRDPIADGTGLRGCAVTGGRAPASAYATLEKRLDLSAREVVTKCETATVPRAGCSPPAPQLGPAARICPLP
eukprot:1149268-Prorocentrum_minimum.AAC.2